MYFPRRELDWGFNPNNKTMTDELLDVRIVKTGRVYQSVPLEKLRRWVTERRVLPNDEVRPVGGTRWLRVSMAPELGPAGKVEAVPQPPTTRASEHAAEHGDLGIAVPAKSRPRRRLRLLEDTVMDMTPMIDVTFQLLIFFMFANQLANPNPIEVPEAQYGRGVLSDGTQAILIDDMGRYYVGENTMEENLAALDELVRIVTGNASLSNGPLDVIISAHKQSRHEQVRILLDELARVPNIGAMRLGVEERQ
jgi:biopolymer transport protein ExbD